MLVLADAVTLDVCGGTGADRLVRQCHDSEVDDEYDSPECLAEKVRCICLLTPLNHAIVCVSPVCLLVHKIEMPFYDSRLRVNGRVSWFCDFVICIVYFGYFRVVSSD